jgi:hypothetical protein
MWCTSAPLVCCLESSTLFAVAINTQHFFQSQTTLFPVAEHFLQSPELFAVAEHFLQSPELFAVAEQSVAESSFQSQNTFPQSRLCDAYRHATTVGMWTCGRGPLLSVVGPEVTAAAAAAHTARLSECARFRNALAFVMSCSLSAPQNGGWAGRHPKMAVGWLELFAVAHG